MRKLVMTAALLLALVPHSAKALYRDDDFVALVSMPLAVDACANLRGVDLVQLASLIAELNEANVPPVAFVQELRYVPVGLVPASSRQTSLVSYVRERRHRGYEGQRLAYALRQELEDRYYVRSIELDRTVYVDESYFPEVVVTRVTRYYGDPLEWSEMPLSVAAVADLGYVPYDRLGSLVVTLNQAYVPPTQFIDVMRYAPVALTYSGPNDFVPYVQDQYSQGVTGPALVAAIDQRWPTYGLQARTAFVNTAPSAPRIVNSGPSFFPSQVRSLAAQNAATYQSASINRNAGVAANGTPVAATGNAAAMNPHGGPPGQLKKNYGYQTGAQVINGGVAPGSVAVQRGHGNGNGGNGKGHGHQAVAVPQQQYAAPAPVQHGHGNGGNGHGRGHQAVAVPQPQYFAPAPQVEHGHGNGNGGNGKGHGHGQPQFVAAPQPQFAPAPAQAPVVVQHGNGNGNGKGHGHGQQVVAAPPQMAVPQPMPVPQAGPPQGQGGPPGQQKGNGKGKGHGKD
jgi:hypothetical protein